MPLELLVPDVVVSVLVPELDEPEVVLSLLAPMDDELPVEPLVDGLLEELLLLEGLVEGLVEDDEPVSDDDGEAPIELLEPLDDGVELLLPLVEGEAPIVLDELPLVPGCVVLLPLVPAPPVDGALALLPAVPEAPVAELAPPLVPWARA